MTDDLPDREVIFAAFADVLASGNWRGIEDEGFAMAAGLSLSTYRRLVGGKYELPRAFGREADATMLEDIAIDVSEPPRDRLFEVVMARFDALHPWREGLQELAKAAPRDPLLAASCVAALGTATGTILDAAKIPSGGVLGLVRRQGLSAGYVTVARAFLKDESDDMGPTMAALERWLDQVTPLAERFLKFKDPLPVEDGLAAPASVSAQV